MRDNMRQKIRLLNFLSTVITLATLARVECMGSDVGQDIRSSLAAE